MRKNNRNDEVREAWQEYDKKELKKEKDWHTSVWKVLAGVMVFVLLFMIADHVWEVYLVKEGKVVEAGYSQSDQIAKFWDEEGQFHMLDMSDYYPALENGHVLLYYLDDPEKARPRQIFSVRVFYYFLLDIFIWRIWKIYRSGR